MTEMCSENLMTSITFMEECSLNSAEFPQQPFINFTQAQVGFLALNSGTGIDDSATHRGGQSEDGNEERAQRLLQTKIEFIPSDEFDLMYAARLYPKVLASIPSNRISKSRAVFNGESLSCLSTALNEPLLSFEEEQHLFCRMNFLKYAAVILRDSLDPNRPVQSQMDQIERYLAESQGCRDKIIRANLRLVVSNANKYRTTNYTFEDLVSDGTLALMEAVDKFDYQRGFRFSTYATHAVRRSFFGKIERKHKDQQRFAVTDPEVMMSTPDRSLSDDDSLAQDQLMKQIIGRLSEYLTDRELHVIKGRFGLIEGSEPKTLVELSDELGICKERVRQVEGAALKKLHAIAAGKTLRTRGRQESYGLSN